MLHCIVRQSFANRTRKLLKLEVAVEQLHKAKLEKNNCNPWLALQKTDDVEWGVCRYFFPCLVGYQGMIPLFRFPTTSKRFCSKEFGFSLSNVLDKQTIFVQNQPPTLGQSATDSGKIYQRFWENQPPTLGKTVTDFGKICH